MAKTNVGQIELDLILNSTAFKSQLQTAVNTAVDSAANKVSGKIGSSFSKIGKIAAAAFSVKAVTGFVKSATELGSTLQEVQNVVDTTFTTMNTEVNKFASSAIKQFGLSETVAKQYIGTMGAMAKSFGFAEKEAYSMSTTLTGLVGDVASFYNLSSDQAYTKLKAVFTGETEALKDLGVVMTQAALDQYALSNGYGKTTAKMSEQEKVALRYNFVLNQLSGASGDFIRTQDGWANQLRVLSLQWQQFMANMGQGFIAVLTPLIKNLNIVMEKLVRLSAIFAATMQQIYGKQPEQTNSVSAIAADMGTLASNTDGVGTAASKAAKKLKSLMGFDNLNVLADNSASDIGGGGGASGIGSSFAGLDTDANLFADALSVSQEEIDKMKKALKIIKWLAIGIGSAILGWKIGNAISALKGLEGGFLGLGSALAVAGGAIEALSLIDAWKNGFNIENMLSALGGGGGVIAGAALIGKTFGKTVLGASIGAIAAGVPMVIVGIKDALLNGLNWLNGIIIPAGTTLVGAGIGAMIGAVGGPMGALIGAILGGFVDLCLYIKDHWREMAEWQGKWFGNTQNAFFGFLDNIKRGFTGLINFVAGVFTGDWSRAWGGIKDLFFNVLGNITTKFEIALGFIKDIFAIFGIDLKEVWNAISEWFSNKLLSFKNGFVNIFVEIKNGILNVFYQLQTAIKTPLNNIISSLNKMITGINKLDFDMPNWVPVVGGKSLGFTIPKIPMLAEGAYVGPNTPQLAMIGDNRHQGEIVAPENKLNEAVANNVRPIITAIQTLLSVLTQNQGGGGDITIPIYLDGALLDEYIIGANDRKALRSGGL